ncbi:Rieske (2Fe-2S) protein [Mariprofundus erugo]|nr:Rieske 2Fe-2S domain-containing protein [Mariprofundus erugo]
MRPGEGQATLFTLKSSVQLSDGRLIELDAQGFLVCFQGQLKAWRNECPHAGSPLDWIPGRFFSESGEQLVCHTHHALFDPLSGDCLSGPCPRGLYALPFRDAGDGHVEVPVQADLHSGRAE